MSKSLFTVRVIVEYASIIQPKNNHLLRKCTGTNMCRGLLSLIMSFVVIFPNYSNWILKRVKVARFSALLLGPLPERCHNSIPGRNMPYPGTFIPGIESVITPFRNPPLNNILRETGASSSVIHVTILPVVFVLLVYRGNTLKRQAH